MRKSYPYVIALALISGGAIYGSAQTTYSGHPVANAFFDEHDRDHDRGWKEGQKRAQEIGYQDGLNDGRHDFESRRDFRPERGGAYKHGDHGYDRRFGDKNRYKEEYRRAYSRGYQEGYHRQGYHPGREHEPGTH